MNPGWCPLRTAVCALTMGSLFGGLPLAATTADETVATAVYSRTGNGYKRERLADGSFQPEYFALSNGGRVAGTTSDTTVDRVTYPEVAAIAMRLLAGHNYHYAQKAEQAKLLIVLHWGATIAFNNTNQNMALDQTADAMAELQNMTQTFAGDSGEVNSAKDRLDQSLSLMALETRARDQVNQPNARLLGFINEINDADGIQRYAGGGTRFDDLMADIEQSRYYIIISAYDFTEAVKREKQKLLWVTRVSIRTTGNRFDDSIMAMMKNAAKYFGQDSGRLIRGEETRGTVELGETRFLGTADDSKAAPGKTDEAKAGK